MKKQKNRLEKCVKITLEKSAGACDRDSADHGRCLRLCPGDAPAHLRFQ